MKPVVRAAAVQFAADPLDKKASIARADRLVRQAAEQGADLILLPETAFTGYTLGPRFREVCEPVPGPSSDAMSALAAELKVHLAFGMGELEGERIRNALLLFGPDGRLLAKHWKAHLYSADVEAGFTPGDSLAVCPTELGAIGLLVCKDSHLIESVRVLDKMGAEIVLIPSVGVAPDDAVYDTIDRWRWRMLANALFGRVFVVRADKVGREGPWLMIGHSMIIHPRAWMLAEGDMKEQVIVADLRDPWPEGKPPDSDRRPDLYGPLAEP